MKDHSGTVMNGNPVVCGGYDGFIYADLKCFHNQRDTKEWKRVIRIQINRQEDFPFLHLSLALLLQPNQTRLTFNI